MPKITISSTRVYYKELDISDALSIQNDICIYQSMKNKAYKELYDNEMYDKGTAVNPTYLKYLYHTNDYFPLSAISEAKSALNSQITWHKKTISNNKNRLKKIDKKIKYEEKNLSIYTKTLSSLIELSKARKEDKVINITKCPKLEWSKTSPDFCTYNNSYMSIYLFEVQHLKPLIRMIRNRVKFLKYRKQRIEERIIRLKMKMKMIHFQERNYMKITGRAQGKYCNNLFKYDHHTNTMTYIDTKRRRISFYLDFPYRKEGLVRVLNLKHATPGKAVCYTLVDKGDYFIIKAAIELDVKYEDCQFEISNGTVGIDINSNHIAIAETDKHGNLIYTDEIGFDLTNKTTNQRKWIIGNAIKEVFDHCTKVNKPLIIEKLDFEQKKKNYSLYNKDTRYHKMLSEFSYRKITEAIYSRGYKDHIGVNEVDPSYTSQIGNIKYARQKGLSVHRCAVYVIARRGMGYRERLPNEYYSDINMPLKKRWHNYINS